jgi:hypothetical protein
MTWLPSAGKYLFLRRKPAIPFLEFFQDSGLLEFSRALRRFPFGPAHDAQGGRRWVFHRPVILDTWCVAASHRKWRRILCDRSIFQTNSICMSQVTSLTDVGQSIPRVSLRRLLPINRVCWTPLEILARARGSTAGT